MKFDRTDGKPAKYAVLVYRWNVSDTYYYSDFRKAKAMFGRLTESEHEAGTTISISIYDMKKDIRMAFRKI